MSTLPGHLATSLASTGRYVLQRELGRGGMATVYLAHDLRHDRLVALKVLDPALAARLGTERFLGEIRVAARLTHPHILPIHDSGELPAERPDEPALLYFTMPYVAGESLRARLARERQLPFDVALAIARDVAAALDHAHRHGIVHRDVKPENILLQDGEAVLADFGVARAIGAASDERLTAAGLALGTPQYMSPEQAMGERVIDARSDVYSLGCVLYEMLAGEPPHTGISPQAIIARRLGQPIAPLGILRPTTTPDLEAVVAKALALVPADRYASAADFAHALSAPSERSAAPGRRPAPRAAGARRVRPRLLAALAGAVLLAILASGIGLLGPRLAPRTPAGSTSLIAVLPLRPSTPDTALARLGRDLALTLGASLDGLGAIGTVDPQTVLSQVDPRGPGSLADERALARRLGAGRVVFGSLVRMGDRVRVDASLLPSDSGAPLARASATAAPDSIAALTDSLGRALLRGIWQRGTAPTPSVDAVLRTRSGAALRAFLEGERLLAEFRLADARDAFAQAIRADSALWLAYYRHAFVTEWLLEPPDSAITATYLAHRAELPERERLLIDGTSAPTMSARRERLQRLTVRFPTYWPGWFSYADELVHYQPLLGTTIADARVALERTVVLAPGFAPAWDHLAWMSVGRDSAAATRAIARLQALGASDTTVSGASTLQLFRLGQRWTRAGGIAGSEALADTLADGIVRSVLDPSDPLLLTAPMLPTWFGLPQLQIELAARVLARRPAAPRANAYRLGLARAWAARGAWDSALAALDQYARAAESDDARLVVYGDAVLGTWLGALPPEAARARRALAASQSSADGRAELAWLDGLAAHARRDAHALAAARAVLRGVPSPATAEFDESLAAFEQELRGDRRAAAARLASLEWRRAEQGGGAAPSRWLTAVDRLAGSRWLAALGDPAQALRLLTFPEAWVPEPQFITNITVAGLVDLERARIEQARGDASAARRDYEAFLRRYDRPVAAHRPLVAAAEAALGKLGSEAR